MRDRITIDPANIPGTVDIELAGTAYRLSLRHNALNDRYTAALYDNDGALLAVDELVYGQKLFGDMYRARIFPALDIVPLDESGDSTDITSCNFGRTVFLTVDDEGA